MPSRIFPPIHILAIISTFLLLVAGCSPPQIGQDDITVQVFADGETRMVTVPAGSTVDQAIKAAGLELREIDKSDPPLYTVLSQAAVVTVTRVREEFVTEEIIIPFERQVARNETLPEGETRLVQPGVNGLREITFRILLEDGAETSRTRVKVVNLREAVPEIVMVGAQSAFAPLVIPGVLVYLSGGNAWLMEGTTANRRPLVTSGDLDGRIFSLSPDAQWLLFSRKSASPPDEEINTLWAVSLTKSTAKPFSLGVKNVVHSAVWTPSSKAIAYTTVEPRATAPGWQANNDVHKITINNDRASKPQKVLEANSGGIYGWWGMELNYSPEGILGYARPDQIGLVDQQNQELTPLLEITPLQTRSDWAWVPGVVWGADSQTLFYVSHAAPPNLVSAEESPNFDLAATSTANKSTVHMIRQSGMFAYPSVSPLKRLNSGDKEKSYLLAYLQAIFPEQSETSRYRLVVMDRDGSNRRELFPAPDAPGLQPQRVVWAPEPLMGQVGEFIALIYQGNLWLIDSGNGQAFQVTGDGLIVRLDWK
jgi:hypothetical protein